MHFLDFISDSPKLFIFQKETNKKNLGGVFCLIYILIVILICIFYINDYIVKEKYAITYKIIEDIVSSKEKEKRLNSSKYNPILNMSFDLKDSYGNSLDERFIIINVEKDGSFSRLERNKFYSKHIHFLRLIIGFNCNISDCKDFNITNLEKSSFFYYLHINYDGDYAVDHYSEESPIWNNNGLSHNIKTFPFSFSNFFLTRLKWEPIDYYDELGIIDKIKGKKSKYHTGDLQLIDSYIVDEELNPLIEGFKAVKEAKIISYFVVFSDDDHCIKYTRQKKNIFDSIGIICSLSSTVYTIMKFIFLNIYSTHFEPDKIIEKILYNDHKGKSISEVKSRNNSGKIEPSLSFPDEIILDKNNLNDYNKTNEENLVDDINDNEKEEIILPKFRMIHYLLNNIYGLKKWKSNKQEIITLCKEILLKYVSIDYLLLNQIKFENLMKDYKWNNPKLKDIKTNELISNLKDKIDLLTINI